MIYYKRLLLIDDDQDDHEFFLEALQEIDSSIRCTAFFDGEQALRQLKNGESEVPDLIPGHEHAKTKWQANSCRAKTYAKS